MIHLVIGLISFAAIFAGAVIGLFVRRYLPGHHLSSETQSAITVSVARANDKVVWSDFGYENNYELGVRRDDYTDVGPFEFEFSQYQSCLLNALATLKSH